MPHNRNMPVRPALPLAATAADPGATMTTKEIADRTGKAHHNVMRDVRRVERELPGGLIKSDETYADDQGRIMPCYRLDRRTILILTSGYSIPLRAAVIDRLEELERTAAAPVVPAVPTNFVEALRLAADNAEEAERQRALADERQRVIEAQAPAIAVVERIKASKESLSVTEAAKLLKMKPSDLFALLEGGQWIYRKGSKGRWQGSAKVLAAGFLQHDGYPIMTAAGSTESYTVRVTPKGLARLAARLAGVQLDLCLSDDGPGSVNEGSC